MCHRLPLAVFLNLKKAYDMVPRRQLQMVMEKVLPHNMSLKLGALLWPMTLRTKHQTSTTNLVARARVPHGDPPSSFLFSIFMDQYLRQVNTKQRKAMASLFFDDVLGLAKIATDLQAFLNNSHAWAHEYNMVLSFEKSCGSNIASDTRMNKQKLNCRNEAD